MVTLIMVMMNTHHSEDVGNDAGDDDVSHGDNNDDDNSHGGT